MRRNASRFVLRASACHQIDSGAPRHRPSVFDVQPDDLSTAGSCATALARRHRTGSLGRVEVTDRDDMALGLHDPRAEARRTEAVLDPSAVGVVHEAAGQRDSAAQAYGRFLRFWDKADPELKGRVREAREALQELTRERPGSP